MEENKKSPKVLWQHCLAWAKEKDAAFIKRCQDHGLVDITAELNELALLPFQDQQESDSIFATLNLPLSGVSHLLGSTAYLPEEMDVWAENAQNWLISCDITKATVMLIADGFQGEGPAWGLLKGAEKLGATVVVSFDKPWEILNDYGVNACALSAELIEKWIAGQYSLGKCQSIFCLTSDISDEKRQRWQEQLGLPIYLQLGLKGVQASVIAWECAKRDGYHWGINYFWPEIVEANSRKLISRYDNGQIVLTALKRSSTSIIRLITPWQGYFMDSECQCHYNSPKFKRIK